MDYKLKDKVDNFILKDQNGKDFELYKNLDKNLLLVFYPKDNSLICSRQLKNYSENMKPFEKTGIRIIGINDGSLEEHHQFCSTKELDLILLSDPELKVIKKFSALYPFRIIKRKLVLINSSAKIVFSRNLPPYSYWTYDKILRILSKNEFYDLTISTFNK